MKRIAYLVSRFPHPTETFIVRELDQVSVDPGLDVSLLSLFAPRARAVVHPAAQEWSRKLRRPRLLGASLAFLGWTFKRPGRVLGSVVAVLRGCRRSPSVLVRNLATLPLAAHHAAWVQREGIEHVHAHYATYPALAAWFIARLTNVSFSFTAHAHDLFVDQSMLRVKVETALFVVAISAFNRRFLEAYGGAADTPIYVIHCGIDLDAFAFRPRDAPREGAVRVICVGSLDEYKGQRYLLEALIEPGLERLKVSFVGDGPRRVELERLAGDLGLSGRVEWVGELDEIGVASALTQSHLFVLPSAVAADGQMDGLPVAIVEALASGTTVVSTRLSGIPEVIDHGVTGFLAEPGNSEAIAEQIRCALAPGAIDHAVGRRLVERDFDVSTTGGDLAELLGGAGASVTYGA